MAINYDDKRFAEVESDKKVAVDKVENTYNGMINETDQHYNNQIEAVEQWGDKQAQLQQEQTDFAIDKIEQQKDKLEQDYQKEQKAAYVDYQKQIDPYGVNAEQMAASGLKGSGYAESSQVAMHNAYQNRVAVARASFQQANVEYDNMMTEARLQNSSALAEIAYTTLQQKYQLALEGFQYKNSLLMEKTNQLLNLDNVYYSRKQDVVSQINTENALKEQQRQFNAEMSYKNASLAEEKRQFDIKQAQNEALIDDDGDKKITGNGTDYFLTIEDAAQYLSKKGYKTSHIKDAKLYDARTWTTQKQNGNTKSEFMYDSYSDYLTNYVKYVEANQ